MATYYSPRIVTDGLTTYFDAGNEKSFPGQNTTNLVPDVAPYIYNNVPGDITATLTALTETYKGKTIYKQVLTPTTTSGVYWLTAGNNPGVGIYYWPVGGGLANRYTGHSVFFKPTVPMHSSPIYTHYSNISGYQSSTNYDDMGDGWYRAHVIWYDTVTRSDGKFWAINPAAATLNTPIVIYWAAPFKEDMNYSTAVSRYTDGTRGAYWYDLAANATATAYNAGGTTYSSVAAGTPILANEAGGALTLDGSNDWIKMASQVTMNSNCTVSAWVKFTSSGEMGLISHCSGGPVNLAYGFKSGKVWYQYYTNAWQEWSGTSSVNTGTWKNVAWVKSGTTMTTYINGVQDATTTLVGNTTGPLIAIGCKWGPCNSDSSGAGTDGYGSMFNGTISNLMLYPSKTLSAAEVKQNYDALKGRYGLS